MNPVSVQRVFAFAIFEGALLKEYQTSMLFCFYPMITWINILWVNYPDLDIPVNFSRIHQLFISRQSLHTHAPTTAMPCD